MARSKLLGVVWVLGTGPRIERVVQGLRGQGVVVYEFAVFGEVLHTLRLGEPCTAVVVCEPEVSCLPWGELQQVSRAVVPIICLSPVSWLQATTSPPPGNVRFVYCTDSTLAFQDWWRVVDGMRRQILLAAGFSVTTPFQAGPIVVQLHYMTVHYRFDLVKTTRLEFALVEALLRAAGRCVSASELQYLLWPEGAPLGNNLAVMVHRIRKRLRELTPRSEKPPVLIRTVKNQGYMIDVR